MIRLKIKEALLVGMVTFAAVIVQAAPFAKTIQFDQPDGTRIELWGQGDEFYAVFETLDGYTVTFDPVLNRYCYATVSADGSQLDATNLEVGKGDPRALGLAQHLRITKEAAALHARARYEQWDLATGTKARWNALKGTRSLLKAAMAGGPIVMSPPSAPTTGNKMGLCLLIDFENQPASVSQSNIVAFCNGDNYTGFGNNGSVKQYYLDNSNNMLTYSNTVTAYIRIPNSLHPRSYYADTTKDCGTQGNKLIGDALAIMKSDPNYASKILPTFNNLTVDANNVVVAFNVFYAGSDGGVWTYGLWPHSGGLSKTQTLSINGKKLTHYQITNIGDSLSLYTFCHENGHMLCGYPDIYDYGYDSKGGAGDFCLMDGRYNEKNPEQICAYLKYAAGWSTTVEVDNKSSLNAQVTATHGEGFNRFYRYAKPGVDTEYFLFENRQKTGRDAALPAAGVAIWHIDELGNGDNQSLAYNATHQNYECTLVQADNLWHFENNVNGGDANDLYFLGNSAAAYANEFNDKSSPSAKWWDGTPSLMMVKGFSANAATMSFSFVTTPPVILSASILPPGRVGSFYNYSLGAAGGVEPYTWSVVSNALPLGLSLNDTTGEISGVPEEVTTVWFSVAVSGDNNLSVTNQFSLTINPGYGIPFKETFENNGAMPDSWVQESSAGSLSWQFTQGSFEGVPSQAHGGSYNACLALDSSDEAVTRLVTPGIDFGEGSHSGRLTFWHYMASWWGSQDELRIYYKTAWEDAWTPIVDGGTFTDSIGAWTKQTVTLPNPSRTYYIAFEGTAKYGYGVCIDDVEVIDPSLPLTLATARALPDATKDAYYSEPLSAAGGEAPYTFAVSVGALPSGMALSSDGIISGTCAVAGTNQFTVQVTDHASAVAARDFTLIVEQPRADLFAEDFEHDGLMPSDWVQEFVTNRVSWAISEGGHFGHPSRQVSGAHNVILWSGDNVNGNSFDQKTRLVSPMINLGQAPASIRLTFWHCMEVWSGCQDELRVLGRSSATSPWILLATYTSNVPEWTQQSLPLPNPTSTYYIAFEGNARLGYGVCIDDVRISDSTEAPIIISSTPLPNGLINAPYSGLLAAVGGKTPYTWAVVSNALPSGLELSSDGVISGTPDAAGVSSFSVRVRDDNGAVSVNSFSLRIVDTLPIPYLETFENSRAVPPGWTLDQLSGSTDWIFRDGSASGSPSAAYAGSNNACLYFRGRTPNTSMLVSPMLDLTSNATNAWVTFWHCMWYDAGDQDELRVYYRTSKTNDWIMLEAYTSDVPVWTQQRLDLPNPSSTYFIAFEGTAKWGGGVCIDNVNVTGNFIYTPYEAWKNRCFTADELAAGTITGNLDDPDRDGLANWLEYAMGLNPKVADATDYLLGGVTTNHLYLTYRQNQSAPDVTFAVEACTSLVTQAWTTNGVFEKTRLSLSDSSNTWWQVTDWYAVPVTNAPQRFLRLKVNLP